MILDFKEIPPANGSDGDQDKFELFAREYIEAIGLEIVSGPDRGQDGGRDILAIETRQGKLSKSKIKWLISCKHRAHSGKSVSTSDEQNITDRLVQFSADGFLGFYSTVVSSGLSNRLDSMKNDYEVKILDCEQIERELVGERNWTLLKRFFPVSSKKWLDEHQKPADILDEYEPLNCNVCGKDLLTENGQKNPSGIIGFVYPISSSESGNHGNVIHHVYAACKGSCDRILEYHFRELGLTTGWEDIADLSIPPQYLRWLIAVLNNLGDGDQYLNDSFSDLKKIIIKLAQNNLRNCTQSERERYELLCSLPDF